MDAKLHGVTLQKTSNVSECWYCRSQVAARSKAWVCGRSPAEIVGSNPIGGIDVCLLWVLCVVRYRSLRRADHSSRGVLPTVVRRCVWFRKPQEWGGHDPRWVAAPQQKKKLEKMHLVGCFRNYEYIAMHGFMNVNIKKTRVFWNFTSVDCWNTEVSKYGNAFNFFKASIGTSKLAKRVKKWATCTTWEL